MSTVGRINFKTLLVFICLFSLPLFSKAQVINEIMYDPQDADDKREWVEIYNSTNSNVDISSWKFLENVSASNHGLSLVQGNASLLPGEYALIVIDLSKFQSSWSFGGTIFRVSGVTAFNNSGATLILKNSNGVEVSRYEYNSSQGASGDGNSLQLQTDGTWIVASPTPGLINSSLAYIPPDTTATTTNQTATTTTTQTTSTNTTNTENQTLSAHYGSAGLSIVESISKFEVGAGRARLSMVGTPIEFRPEMKYSYSGNMTFKWSFGDGAIGYGQVLSHSYAYPGDYIVVLNVSSPGGQAVSRTNVKIVPADISISLASVERVEVFNNSKNEINLFGRAVSSQGHFFIFPEDTIIRAGQKISFDSKITGLTSARPEDTSLVVVGMEVKPQEILAKIEEQKSTKIISIRNEIAALEQQRLALLQGETPNLKITEDKNYPLVIETENIKDKDIEQTAMVLNSIPEVKISKIGKWMEIFKLFFLRTRE